MVKITIKYKDIDCKNRQKTFRVDSKRFIDLFNEINSLTDPIWFEFDFFILEDFYRDQHNSILHKNFRILSITYNDIKRDPITYSDECGYKNHLIYVMSDIRNKKINSILH